jgi:dTDP-glucose 4,6-dehydratase
MEESKLKILITGGAGFIGSNFVRWMLQKHDGNDLVVLDKLTYAGNLDNLKDVMSQITFIKGDICRKRDVGKVIKNCDAIVNFAAETHVDRSILKTDAFIKTDVYGTYTLLELSREHNVKKFLQVSTDEVYGSKEKDSFNENDPLNPSNPYSASKAGADLIALAYCQTYGVPVIITRSSNNYGPFQHPEKFLPKMIVNALQNKPLPLYGDGQNVRDWLFVLDNCEAIDIVLHRGKEGDIYNVSASEEKTNIEVAKNVLERLGKPEELIMFVKDRPGHDRRYSLENKKVRELGWSPKTSFSQGLQKAIDWYRTNEWWWKPIVVSAEKFEYWKQF